MKMLSPLHNYPRRDNMSYYLKDRLGRAIPERICAMDETVIAAQLYWDMPDLAVEMVRVALTQILGRGSVCMEDLYQISKYCPGLLHQFVVSGYLQGIKNGTLDAEVFFITFEAAVLQIIDDDTGFISLGAFIDSRES